MTETANVCEGKKYSQLVPGTSYGPFKKNFGCKITRPIRKTTTDFENSLLYVSTNQCH